MNALLWLAVPAGAGVAAIASGRLVFKLAVPLLCAVLIGSLVRTGRFVRDDVGWVVLALIFSAVGDAFLSTRVGDVGFLIGVALYLMAHLAYLAFCLRDGRPHLVVGVVALAFYLGYFSIVLANAISDPVLTGAVLVYLVVSCLVLAASAGKTGPPAFRTLFVTGIALILLSDTAISLYEFRAVDAAAPVILPTYYAAHLSITAGLMVRGRS